MGTAIYSGLEGKRVVVTGGGSGIGAALVEAFAEQKGDVHFLDICAEESQTLVERLGSHVTFHHCDLTDLDALEATFKRMALSMCWSTMPPMMTAIH